MPTTYSYAYPHVEYEVEGDWYDCSTTATSSFANGRSKIKVRTWDTSWTVKVEHRWTNCYHYESSTGRHITWTPYTTAGSWSSTSSDYVAPTRSRKTRLRQAIRQRYSHPGIVTSRKCIQPAKDIRESRARETLCRVIGQEAYRRFLIDGFVSVRSRRSGKVYVIYPGHNMTKVYDRGVLVERLCVVLPGDFPPTDSLITRYLMILNDEDHFRSLANISPGSNYRPTTVVRELEPLISFAKRIA